MMLADGSVVTAGPDREPELFWATVGGMGLTGLILAATFAMLPIETSRCAVDTERVADLDDAAGADGERRRRVPLLRRVDRSARRGAPRSGAACSPAADHARVDELSPRQAVTPTRLPPRSPRHRAAGARAGRRAQPRHDRRVQRALVPQAAPRRRIGQIVAIPRFFHPLDVVGHWNRLYGRRGFLQYQFVVPFGAERALQAVIERLAAFRHGEFLRRAQALRRVQPGPAELSRTRLDAGSRHPRFGARGSARCSPTSTSWCSRRVDGITSPRTARTTPDAIRRGYPRLAEWQRVRDAVDPGGVGSAIRRDGCD